MPVSGVHLITNESSTETTHICIQSVCWSRNDQLKLTYPCPHVCLLTGSVIQPGGEVCWHGEGAGAEEDAAGGLPAWHLQPHDPQLPCLQCLHTGGQCTGKRKHTSAHCCTLTHTHQVLGWGGAVLMKGCNKFEEAIRGLIGTNVITQTTEHTSSSISFPATHNH